MLINFLFTLFQMDNLFFPKNKQYFLKNRNLNLYIQKKSNFFFKKEAKSTIDKQLLSRNGIKHRPKKNHLLYPTPFRIFSIPSPLFQQLNF